MAVRYITDEITPEQALAFLKGKEEGKQERLQRALDNKAVPGYNTSVGWLGYCTCSDDWVIEADEM
jgi:hypothetical protein